MSLAKKIVQLRKERNLTQKELARIVGVHFSHMSRYERGISLPSVEVVRKIAQLFRVSADYLLFDDSNAMIRANMADQELLQQFEQISRMSDTEKATIKAVLEGMLLKHHLETMLGVKQAPSLPTSDTGSPTYPPVQSSTLPPDDIVKHLQTVFQDGTRQPSP